MALKKMTYVSLGDLVKRVPKDQLKQFEAFQEKTKGYQKKLSQYPDKLPHIDWDFYRRNVRKDYVKMVEQFQIKYEELNHVFASRHEVLDFGKYYTEMEKLAAEAQKDVANFIDGSNSRICIYEEEIRRLKRMIPYENMTIEQFIEEREDIAQYIPRQGKALFWPHVPVEQRVGPAGVDYDDFEGKKKAKIVTEIKKEEPTKGAAAAKVAGAAKVEAPAKVAGPAQVKGEPAKPDDKKK